MSLVFKEPVTSGVLSTRKHRELLKVWFLAFKVTLMMQSGPAFLSVAVWMFHRII